MIGLISIHTPKRSVQIINGIKRRFIELRMIFRKAAGRYTNEKV